MRNVFDQYAQPENRVTHALMTALHEDPALLRSFLDRFVGDVPRKSASPLVITEQSYPGKLEEIDPDSQDSQRKGLPDAWVTNDEGWCLLIENKVLAQVTRDQIVRHLSLAQNRLGYQRPTALVITIREPAGKLPDGVLIVRWQEVYQWLRNSKSEWARKVANFLVVMEGRMVEAKQLASGTLTAFEGITFSEEVPYTYLEAKRLLKLMSSKLHDREDVKALFPHSSQLWSRGAITGQKDDVIWDVLSPEKDFARCLHLTIGLGRTDVNAMLTVPNNIGPQSVRRLKDMGEPGFRDLVGEVLQRMERLIKQSEGMEPRLVARQRRYPSIKATPFDDATIDFDLRTIDGSGPKKQHQWVNAIYGCLAEKNSNFSFQIGAVFPYRSCESVRTPAILDRMVEAWLACEPFISVLTPA